MSKVKIESNELGMCPYCESQEIDYGAVVMEGDMLYFPCQCEKCGRYFEEWHKLEFTGHNVGSCGEYEAVIGEEIEYEEEE